MTIDELIKYAEEIYKEIKDCEYVDRDILIYKIALATLKAHKQGLKLCEFKETCSDWSCDYRPVQTELDEIIGELE